MGNGDTPTNINTTIKSTTASKTATKEAQQPLASLADVFSFSSATPEHPLTYRRTRPFLVLGLVSSFVTGLAYPVMIFLFARVFEKFTVEIGGDSFMDGIRQMVCSFLATTTFDIYLTPNIIISFLRRTLGLELIK